MGLPGGIAWPRSIVSGGQTGVDRGALDAAIAAGITHGGWCPRGRLAEDGPIAGRYQLRETPSAKYTSRTRCNVIDSDATLILCCGPLTGGTELTLRLAQDHARPWLVIDLQQAPDAEIVRQWIEAHRVGVLNVAGPRESSYPGIAEKACRFLLRVLGERPTAELRPA